MMSVFMQYYLNYCLKMGQNILFSRPTLLSTSVLESLTGTQLTCFGRSGVSKSGVGWTVRKQPSWQHTEQYIAIQHLKHQKHI